jgi:uncharacterized protein (TIGR04255 family)
MDERMKTRKKLVRPPIVEVVCGFVFPPISGMDAVAAGAYWASIRDRFPAHTIQPAVTDVVGFTVTDGAAPQRALLVSADDQYVVQIQADRFYFNWRKRLDDYPHFTGAGGVLELGMKEFTLFSDHCVKACDCAPQPVRVDLAKVDLLPEGREWSDTKDLVKVLPLLRGVVDASSNEPEVAMRWSEQRNGADFVASLHLGLELMFNELPKRAVKMETRIAKATSPERDKLLATFEELNDTLNAIFFGLIPETELHRFRGLK